MSKERLELILQMLDTKKNQWFGGPSAAGSLRTVTSGLALWKPPGMKHCIWELALHIAYWEYAVRRMLENGQKGGFPRTPSDWPAIPVDPSDEAWKTDRKFVKQERDALINTMRAFDEKRLETQASSSSKYSYLEIVTGIAQHSVYHTGQISLLKRLGKHALPT